MYADNVLKGFATSFSVVMSCIISASFLEKQPLSAYFICGAMIVIASALMYSLFPVSVKPLTPRANSSSSSSVVGMEREHRTSDEEQALLLMNENRLDNNRDANDSKNQMLPIHQQENVPPQQQQEGTVSAYVDKGRAQISLEQRGSGKKKSLAASMTV